MVFRKRRPRDGPARPARPDGTSRPPVGIPHADHDRARLSRAPVSQSRAQLRPARICRDTVMPAVLLQVDGTPGDRVSDIGGVGLIVRALDGQVLRWHVACVQARTCNEAEYQAVIVGLRFVQQHYPAVKVYCLTDSRVVVDQVTGHAAVRAPDLVPLHREVLRLMRQRPAVTFVAIARNLNRLADALAWEALGGRTAISRVVECVHTTDESGG